MCSVTSLIFSLEQTKHITRLNCYLRFVFKTDVTKIVGVDKVETEWKKNEIEKKNIETIVAIRVTTTAND